MKSGVVISVNKSANHSFSKYPCAEIFLVEGSGVKDDAHAGATVKHRSRVARDPSQLNLRQVHLLHAELFNDLQLKGFEVSQGQIGENITTSGIDLLNLPRDTVLKIGAEAKIKITGLRNPCKQLNAFQDGLMKAVLDQDAEGNLIRLAGIMGIVISSGPIKIGDIISVELPDQPYVSLDMV